MKRFSFRIGKTGTVIEHAQEFLLALMLAGRIINRHCVKSQNIAGWLDQQEDFFAVGYYNYPDTINFSFTLSGDLLIVAAKTQIAKQLTGYLDAIQGPKKEWHTVLFLLYVYGTALSEEASDNGDMR